MGAIRPHTTEVDKTGDWDGPGAVADAPNDREVLRYMHTWVNPDGDPDAKQSYKFPHHRPEIGAPAVIAAVNNALARLSQADIPDADKPGVEQHLRKHRQDAGLEEDSHHPVIERRTIPVQELRVVQNDDRPRISGYAAVFNSPSADLGGFRELIMPGTFTRTIVEDDIRALYNHDPNFVLGRNTSGTLRLAEDDTGLRIEIDPPDVQWARDLINVMQRGDVNQMSFGFYTREDRWINDGENTIRELHDVQLMDVSVVTFPAYPQTIANARDILNAHQANVDALSQEDGVTTEQDSDTENQAQERHDFDLKRKRLDISSKLT